MGLASDSPHFDDPPIGFLTTLPLASITDESSIFRDSSTSSSSPTTTSLVPQSTSSNGTLSTANSNDISSTPTTSTSLTSTSTSSTASIGPIIGGVVGGVVLLALITIVVIIKRRRRRHAIQIPTANLLLNNSHTAQPAVQHDIPSSKRPRRPDGTPGSTNTSSQSQNQTTPNYDPTLSQSVSLREVESAIQRQMEMMMSMISERMMAFESAQSPPDYSSRASE
ncbi:hypothetical protein H2248_003227 [Termitomyces sp. 'cryptogamus']|nr:hypothetical protein H2248_003227 [Termitomyces sp. 'cryptogamus']